MCLWNRSYQLPQSPFALWWCQTTLSEIFLFRRMSFSRFPTSLLVTWPKYPRMRLSHKILNQTGSCISLTFEMSICRAVKGSSASIARPIFQRRRFFFHLPPLLSIFSHHIGKQRKQKTVQDSSLPFYRFWDFVITCDITQSDHSWFAQNDSAPYFCQRASICFDDGA